MGGDAVGLGVQPIGALVANQRIVAGRFADDDRPRRAEDAELPMQIFQVVRTLAAALFAGGDDEYHAAGMFELVRQLHRRRDERSDTAFHIAGTTAE